MRRNLRVDKLAKREENATVKRILSLSVLSVILAILLFVFGIGALGKFADLLDRVFIKDKTENQDSNTISAPTFDKLLEATNSADIVISGIAYNATKVEIYINDQDPEKSDVVDSKFKVDSIKLQNGENLLKVKAFDDSGRESEFSQTQTIIFDNTKPTLEIETPSEGQNFSDSNRINVSGKTEADSQVYANGFLATVNSDGKFDVFVPVSEGETNIEVKAFDNAGNVNIQNRKINFRK